MSTHLHTVQTRSRALVGTTIYRATAQQMIPLDDPTAEGNCGLEGYDEDAVRRDFKSKAAAVRWLGQQFKTLPHVINGDVVKVEWEADEFEDTHRGEWVLDGIETSTWAWYYRREDDGGCVLDDEGKPWWT